MEIRDLKYLAAAASTSNFGRAAKSLGVETSTISRHIARLEDELGLALFERANTGVHLTPGGKAVMVHVNRTLAEFDGRWAFGTPEWHGPCRRNPARRADATGR